MPRQARKIMVGAPHHVMQRGNRRQQVFFTDEDRSFYLAMVGSLCRTFQVRIWAYCLMTNHVHFIMVPGTPEGLSRAMGEAHKHYTFRINQRFRWSGFLWQGRYQSKVLSEGHLFAAVRYVECNPVRAGIVRRAEDYAWSSAEAHVYGRRDSLLSDCRLSEMVTDWSAYLRGHEAEECEEMRQLFCPRKGRPRQRR